MSETTVKWHPGWPPEPTDYIARQYLLTIDDGETPPYVEADYYLSFSVFETVCEDFVKAWAELPPPYEEKSHD